MPVVVERIGSPPNGDVANKIGTYMVAVLARRHDIPFYVACRCRPSTCRTPDGSRIPIEERSSDEVLGHGAVHWAAAGGCRCAIRHSS